jgi:hypothetical protein
MNEKQNQDPCVGVVICLETSCALFQVPNILKDMWDKNANYKGIVDNHV